MLTKIYTIIYCKNDKHLAQTRIDMSDNANRPTLEFLINDFCEANEFNVADYEAVELSSPLPKDIHFGKHIYDVATNSVIVDPTWIEPPSVETASIPVSGI
jgi:hypothetical protein